MSPSISGDNLERGFVSLVGAGPGDPGLVTVRALERIRNCEAVVHDRLIPNQLLEEAPNGAEIVDVGKHPGSPKVPQEEIHRILIDRARQGLRVVRLKGGDPGVFGRAGEEIEALRSAKVPFEVIPGVTAGVAAAAAAGIPLTHRKHASSVTFVTGHEDPARGGSHLDWEEMARAGTLVFYMIGKHLPEIGERLIQSGRPESTPAIIVREASQPTQSITPTTLSDLKTVSEIFQPGFPAVLIVGEVGGVRGRNLANLPLADKTIVLTHPAEPDDPLRLALTARGARVLSCPSIRIEPVEELGELATKFSEVEGYEWVFFTSKNAVRSVRGLFEEKGWDVRRFGKVKVASVGQGTARELTDWGIRPDFIPTRFTGSDLAREFETIHRVRGSKFLFPCSEIARDTLEKAISEAGGEFDRVTAYRTVTPEESWDLAREAGGHSIDGVCFTSSSTVTGFRARVGDAAFHRLFATATAFSIGPKTTQTLAEMAVPKICEAEISDFRGMADLIASTEGDNTHR